MPWIEGNKEPAEVPIYNRQIETSPQCAALSSTWYSGHDDQSKMMTSLFRIDEKSAIQAMQVACNKYQYFAETPEGRIIAVK